MALRCEARPLIAHFGLQARGDLGKPPCYERDDLRLIVSGVGRLAAAAATGVLYGLAPRDAAWLNIGIAGHAHRALGEVVLAATVRERASDDRFVLEPPPLARWPLLEVETVDEVVEDYPAEDVAVEMEAAGVAGALRRFGVPLARFCCCKIVSDNAESSTEQLDARRIEALLEAALPEIEALLALLRKVSQ